MSNQAKDQIRQTVRNRYKEIALQGANQISCCSSSNGCSTQSNYNDVSSQLGYTDHELSSVPDGANLGLGCGNPQVIADLKTGEIVLDLGSGGGFDCFLAARQVTVTGKVIGVDMTPEMISRARSNAEKGGFTNTEFRLGEIEHLPVADNTVDVIISNCVINLSPDKPQVFNEAYRVLKSGGRIAISDVVATTELPLEIKNNLDEFYAGCVSGASAIQDIELILQQSGFVQISIEPKDESREFIKDWVEGTNIEDYIVSAVIKAVKP
ncbi:arsenite methyltransferase [Schinkia azotoformans]|uniref:arsenite methyltransferase n=1 Tax=Schinkia azotoformans TaxID=1454 RepID=UPI002DBB62AC|nr:arsenite methyltransferase [Schinkia azotoformans]MEC1743318.1 arsenite methyltransferase [Schinkia azotoformans]MEC1769262.1 arsenite methyltransferase [Schinkia azotoformans]MEC1788677.1 arsenite methyltransferase [Schinkia azotoformans]MED4377348.1 arsenite methyltransferase [Schinkia azotoformans]MED4420185.1 arsenite methyltransferase [Schinkia azotoformans]